MIARLVPYLVAVSLCLFVAAPCLAQGPAAPAQAPAAQNTDAPVIAVLDVREILSRSKAAQAIQPQFEKLKKTYEDEVNKVREQIQGDGQQLNAQRSLLTPDAFAQREQALQQRASQLNSLVNDRKRTLDLTFDSGLGQIRNVMLQVSTDIAKERSINIILPKDAVVIIARNLEITEEVLKRVDQKLPTVTLKVVQPGQGSPGGQAAAPKPQNQPSQPSQPKKK